MACRKCLHMAVRDPVYLISAATQASSALNSAFYSSVTLQLRLAVLNPWGMVPLRIELPFTEVT